MTSTSSTTGIFREISHEFCEAVKEITDQGNDAEVRKRIDGTYDIYVVEKTRHNPREKQKLNK